MPINDPYAPPTARKPRLQILRNGQPVGGALSFEVTNNGFYAADTFSAKFAINADPNFGVAYWGSQKPPILLDLQASLDNGKTWKSLLIGQVDHMAVHMDAGLVMVDGRDLTSYFIDAKTQQSYLNQTSSQVVQTLAQKRGLTADVTPTKTLVGRFFGDDHERMTLSEFSRTTTEWNLLCSLAQHEQFDVYVTGTTVHFHPRTPIDSNPWELVWMNNAWGGDIPWMNAASLSLERSMAMAKDVVVVVRSWNSLQERGFTKWSPSSASLPSINTGTDQEFAFTVPDMTPAAAQAMANRLREQITQQERLITIEAPADLIIMPRNMLKIVGTGSSWDQVYFVDWVRRCIDFESGFGMVVHAKNHSPQTSVLTT